MLSAVMSTLAKDPVFAKVHLSRGQDQKILEERLQQSAA